MIISEAFPPNKHGERKKFVPLSLSHDLLTGIQIKKEKIVYKPLLKTDIEEIKKLHKEWFPLSYEDDYFQQIFANKSGSYFTIGAYYAIDNKDIILGLALCEFRPVSEYFVKHTSPKAIEEICRNIDFNEEVQSYLRCEDYNCAYIMTIGVLDECRQLHIGSELINRIIDKAMTDNICIGVYLDVVYYNSSAIKFYENNGFKRVTTLKNYYNINENLYDCDVFLRIFTRKEKDDYRAKHYGFLRKLINLIIITPLNIVYKIIIFIFLFQCFRNKIKVD
jgi:GNAT superfamily N-acetyltransferase